MIITLDYTQLQTLSEALLRQLPEAGEEEPAPMDPLLDKLLTSGSALLERPQFDIDLAEAECERLRDALSEMQQEAVSEGDIFGAAEIQATLDRLVGR